MLTPDRTHAIAAWMSAHSGKNRLYVASASLPDLAFRTVELSPGTPGAQGHPKLAAGPGRVFAVWDESLDAAAPASAPGHGEGHGHGHGPMLSGTGRSIMLASSIVNPDHTAGTPRFGPAALAPRSGSFQLNPAIAVGPEGAVIIAWNELDTTGKRVVVVRQEAGDVEAAR